MTTTADFVPIDWGPQTLPDWLTEAPKSSRLQNHIPPFLKTKKSPAPPKGLWVNPNFKTPKIQTVPGRHGQPTIQVELVESRPSGWQTFTCLAHPPPQQQQILKTPIIQSFDVVSLMSDKIDCHAKLSLTSSSSQVRPEIDFPKFESPMQSQSLACTKSLDLTESLQSTDLTESLQNIEKSLKKIHDKIVPKDTLESAFGNSLTTNQNNSQEYDPLDPSL